MVMWVWLGGNILGNIASLVRSEKEDMEEQGGRNGKDLKNSGEETS